MSATVYDFSKAYRYVNGTDASNMKDRRVRAQEERLQRHRDGFIPKVPMIAPPKERA